MEVDSVSIYHLVCDVSAQVACVMSCVSSDYGGNLSLGAHYTGDGQVIRRHWTTLVHISPGLEPSSWAQSCSQQLLQRPGVG